MKIFKFLIVPLLAAMLVSSCATQDPYHCSKIYYDSLIEPVKIFRKGQADNDNINAIISYFSFYINNKAPKNWNDWDNLSKDFFSEISTNSNISANYPVSPSQREIDVAKKFFEKNTEYMKCEHKKWHDNIPKSFSRSSAEMIFKINDEVYDNEN